MAGKLLVSFGIFLLLQFSNGVIPTAHLLPLEYRYPSYIDAHSTQVAGDPIKWVVVLAHGHGYAKGIPASSMLTGETLFCPVGRTRPYMENPGSKLLLSGGAVLYVVSQAGVMAEVARSLGVPSETLSWKPVP